MFDRILPVCFGCAWCQPRRSLIIGADGGVGAGPADGGSAFAGVVSICFILFVRAIAASRREAQSLNRLPPPSPRASDRERRAEEIERRCVCRDVEAFAIEPIKPGLLGLRG